MIGGGEVVGTAVVEMIGDNSALVRSLKESQAAVTSTMANVQARMSAMGKSMQSLGRGLSLGVTLPMVGLGKVAVDEFSEVQKVNAQTAAAIKSTGGAANVSAKEIRNLAGRMGELAAKDAEEVQAAQNVLLTFTKVRNEVGKGNNIFDQASKAALNMSARLGTDLSGAMTLVGKAVNDPIKGLSALARVGVTFDEQQKKQITTLVESGKTMEAQKIILAELQVEFGGSAKAAGDAASPTEKLKLAFNDMAESIGKILMPIVRQMAETLEGLAERFGKLSPEVKRFVVIAAGIAAAVGPVVFVLGSLVRAFSAVIGAVRAVTAVLSANPYVLLVAATVALVVLIVKNWDTIKAVTQRTFRAVANAISDAWSWIREKTGDALGWIVDKLASFVDFWFNMAGKVLTGAEYAFGWMPGIGDKIGALRDRFNSATDAIVADLRRAADGFRGWEAGARGSMNRTIATVNALENALRSIPTNITTTHTLVTSGTVAAGTIRARAHGGPVEAGQPYLVGERGMELFVPNRSGEIVSSKDLSRLVELLADGSKRSARTDQTRVPLYLTLELPWGQITQQITLIQGRNRVMLGGRQPWA